MWIPRFLFGISPQHHTCPFHEDISEATGHRVPPGGRRGTAGRISRVVAPAGKTEAAPRISSIHSTGLLRNILAEKFLPFVLEFNGKWQLASLRCNRGGKPQQPISPSIGTDDRCRKNKEADANHTIRHDLMRDRAAVSVRKKVGAGCGCCRL